MNSENGIDGFRERVALVVGGEEPFVWAKRHGIAAATWDRLWNQGVVPKADTLLKIARAGKVSVDWLLTGQGEMHVGQPSLPPTDAPGSRDPDLYGRVLEAISAVYKEVGWGIGLRQLGAEAAQIADDIAAEGLAPDEKPPAVKAAAAMLRRQLRAAAADPAASTKGRV